MKKENLNTNNFSLKAERLKLALIYIRLRLELPDLTNEEISEGILGSTNFSAALNGNAKYLTDNLFVKLCKKFPFLNVDWFLNNEGKMTLDNPLNESEGVPYFDGEVTSTITTSFLDVPTNPTFYINIPPLNDCDAYITNRGDSMFPKYRNGEILGIKRIYNFNVLQWGESHLVITNANANDMRTVKNVHPHPESDKVILRASNPNNAGDTVVSKEDILEIYIIKANLDITHL